MNKKPGELHCADSQQAEATPPLSVRPEKESYADWFRRRRPQLERMIAERDPKIHTIEEQDAVNMAVVRAVKMFDFRADELYRQSAHAPFALRELLVEVESEVTKEVMDQWRSGSEDLRTWGFENVEPEVKLRLEDRAFKWEHRATRAIMARAVAQDSGSSLVAILERLQKLSAQQSREEAAQTTIWVSKEGYSFQTVGSGLFQESLLDAIRRLGVAMGEPRNPVQFCLENLLKELICEMRPIDDPQVTRLSRDQLPSYLQTSHSSDTLIPTSGFINNVCEALQWYCLRLSGAAPIRSGGPRPKASTTTHGRGAFDKIDTGLKEIAAARPTSHAEVFRKLDERNIRRPSNGIFSECESWHAGFLQDPKNARAWLSKRWRVLGLSPFPRGKKLQLP